jgi:DNA repair exonuclease SbcCD ATPase subunit
MKLDHVSMEGFRGFGDRVEVDLSADVIIIAGPNGTGKTSILDAILWSLTGRLLRVGDDVDDIVSRFAPAGVAQVTLRLRDEAGAVATVVRSQSHEAHSLAFESQGRRSVGRIAETALLDCLWPAGLSADDAAQAFHTVLTRSVYLQQDRVREFISDDTATRFSAISQLVGAGRIGELQTFTEVARNAWSRATTQREEAVAQLEERLSVLRAEADRYADSDTLRGVAQEQWDAWWQSVSSVREAAQPSSPLDSSAASQVDSTIRLLQNDRRAAEREASALDRLLADARALASSVPVDAAAIDRAREQLAQEEVAFAECERQLQESRAANERYTADLAKRQDDERELIALAQLALRHLDAHCPVCEQAIDTKKTHARLEARLKRAPRVSDHMFASTTPAMLSVVETRRETLQKARVALDDLEGRRREWDRRLAIVQSDLRDANITDGGNLAEDNIVALRLAKVAVIKDLVSIIDSGERLTVTLASVSGQARRAEALAQIDEVQTRVAEARRDVARYRNVHKIASEVIDAVRRIADDVVSNQIERIDPLLQRVYARIDPHPAFRVAQLKSYVRNRKGRIEALVRDPRSKIDITQPENIFSSSQANALAVSIFMAMNLSSDVPIESAILDDPLQSLDDINLLGLIDVLRRTRARRQLILSTHDPRFAELLARKFRPVTEGHRTSTVELSNWERRGATVIQTTAATVPQRLQVVA